VFPIVSQLKSTIAGHYLGSPRNAYLKVGVTHTYANKNEEQPRGIYGFFKMLILWQCIATYLGELQVIHELQNAISQ